MPLAERPLVLLSVALLLQASAYLINLDCARQELNAAVYTIAADDFGNYNEHQ